MALHEFTTAAVQSALNAMRSGDASLAEARLDDAWFLCDRVASLPSASN